MTDAAEVYGALREESSQVLVGSESILEGLTISLLTGGHVLLEGVPGVAKTTIAKTFSRVVGLDYSRVQMTPDLLPADVTGTKIYRQRTGEFELQRGPVFANLVVADEINRATPKTQSALLEAMQEQQVTVEGDTLALPLPFMVIATQNPIEMEGTFGLPEAQRDRFQQKLIVDIPERRLEEELLDLYGNQPDLGPADVERIVTPGEIQHAREQVTNVFVDNSVRDYLLDIVGETRASPDVEYGASPRASLSLLQAAKAKAALADRNYLIPDDVKSLTERVLAHRLVLSTDAELADVTPREVVRDVVDTVAPPDVGAREPTERAVVSDGGGSKQPEETSDGE